MLQSIYSMSSMYGFIEYTYLRVCVCLVLYTICECDCSSEFIDIFIHIVIISHAYEHTAIRVQLWNSVYLSLLLALARALCVVLGINCLLCRDRHRSPARPFVRRRCSPTTTTHLMNARMRQTHIKRLSVHKHMALQIKSLALSRARFICLSLFSS